MAEEIKPPIDYTSKDYAGFRNLLLDAKRTRIPEWTSESPNDFGVVLIELFSYIGDILSYYGDRIANESFLRTATQRSSVLGFARLLDYRPSDNLAATVTLNFTVTWDPGQADGTVATIPAGFQVSTPSITALETGVDPVVFEVDADTTITKPTTTTSAVATQGEVLGRIAASRELLGVSDGTADQTFTLFRSPVVQGSVDIYVDEDGDPATDDVKWSFIDHLIDAGPSDAAFTTETDENDVVRIIFGDDANGRVPPLGADISASYRVGGGEDGNVGPNSLTEIVSPLPSYLTSMTVSNPAAASGGSDAESTEEIRRNAPQSLRSIDRAVTLDDYASLAFQGAADVKKANADATVYTNVTVYIATAAGSMPPTATKNTVAAYLNDRKMVNATVTVANPSFIGVNITADPVQVLSNYDRGRVERDIEFAIRNVVAFENVDFAQRISVSEIFAAIQAVRGVQYATLPLMARADGVQSGANDLTFAANEIPQAGIITVNAVGGIVGT